MSQARGSTKVPRGKQEEAMCLDLEATRGPMANVTHGPVQR